MERSIVMKLFFVGVGVWLATHVAQAGTTVPRADQGEDRPGSAESRLAEIDARLDELQEQETALRAQWEPQHRTALREKQALLAQDKELRAIQQKINERLEEVRELQEDLQQLLQVRLAEQGQDQPDADSLQRQIVDLRRERQQLLRERHQLQRRQGRSPLPAAGSGE